MKRLFLLVPVILVLLAGCALAADDDYVFRKVKWGMTPSMVKEHELLQGELTLHLNENFCLSYSGPFGDFESTINYYFIPSQYNIEGWKLNSIDVIITPLDFTLDGIGETFQRIAALITDKYGQGQAAPPKKGDTTIVVTWETLAKDIKIVCAFPYKGSPHSGNILLSYYTPGSIKKMNEKATKEEKIKNKQPLSDAL